MEQTLNYSLFQMKTAAIGIVSGNNRERYKNEMLKHAGGIASLGGQVDKQVRGHLYQYLELVLRWAAIKQTCAPVVGVAPAVCPGSDKVQTMQRRGLLQLLISFEQFNVQYEHASIEKVKDA